VTFTALFRRFMALVALLAVVVALSACGARRASPTAEQIVASLQRQGLPIGHTEAVTAASDNFGLLGQPGEYTSAVEFQDTRLLLAGTVFTPQDGGRIEVFAGATAAARRYQERQSNQQALVLEHDILEGPVVLMLARRLTSDQVAAYQTALQQVLAQR
jgi:hypothetical protein